MVILYVILGMLTGILLSRAMGPKSFTILVVVMCSGFCLYDIYIGNYAGAVFQAALAGLNVWIYFKKV